MTRSVPAALAAFAALMLAGCGYALVQTNAPYGAERILLEPFVEEVPLGLSADLTRAMAERLAAGGVRLTQDRALAVAVLSGTIASARTSISPTSASLGGRVNAYRLTVKVTASLVSPADESLWTGAVTIVEDFLPGVAGEEQILATEASRRRALRRLAESAAADLHAQLVMKSALR